MAYTNEAWSSPESELDAGAYCSVCIVDQNPAGQPKVKGLCWLPVRSQPGAPINKNALQNAAGRLFQVQGMTPENRHTAAQYLVREMRAAGMEVGSESLLRLAGVRQ